MPSERRAVLSRDVYLELHRLHEAVNGPFSELFRHHGLSQTQFNVLRILRGAGEPLPCSTIGERLVTRVPDVTRLVDRMERAGLVERVRSEADRRVVLVHITDEGLDTCDLLDEPVLDLHERQLTALSLTKLAELRSLLREALKP